MSPPSRCALSPHGGASAFGAAVRRSCCLQFGSAGAVIERRQIDVARNELGQPRIVAHENERATSGRAGLQKKIHERLAQSLVERRRGFIGDHQFRSADQGARRGDALLLADRKL